MACKKILECLILFLFTIYKVVTFHHILETADCPGLINFDDNGLHGAIYSPNFPSNYSDGDECNYLIKVPENYTIELIVYEFRTESCCDTLYIYNGAGSSLIQVLQGTIEPGTKISSNNENEMFLRFMSDLTNNDIGFYIDYHAVPNITYNSPTESPYYGNNSKSVTLNESVAGISSPRWPDEYPLDVTYEYLLEANNSESYIYLEFITFATESCCDFVEIFDGENGDDQSKLIAQLKGTDLSQTVYTSSGPKMFLRFFSDLTNVDKGFNAIFHSVQLSGFYIHKPFEGRNITHTKKLN
uniref:CUB domain-containing protein n=1 Tax=Parastrongyloides trichosuri TaxID=131310 RepID=A0A0N4Z0I2_PARTI